MQRSKKLTFQMSLFSAAIVVMIAANPVSAQTESALDGFKKTKVDKQKAPHRQLALRIENQQEKKKVKKQGKKQQPKTIKPKTTKTDKPAPPNVSDERRKELMLFLETNHKELKPLLNQLKKKRNWQYQNVLRSLDVKIRQLQTIEKNSPARHKQMLEAWTLQSKIQLLSAQIAIKKSEKEKNKLRSQIRPLIQKQIDIRIKQVETETKNAKERYERMAKQLSTLVEKRDAGEVDRRMNQIDKTSQRIVDQTKKKKTENIKKEQASAADLKKKKDQK